MTSPKRVALYARFSSDLQNARSADDQLAALRKDAAQRGWLVVSEFKDEGISGSSTVNRPGYQAMIAAAFSGAFEVLFAEALDRLSRDVADSENLRKRMKYFGIDVVTQSEGSITTLHTAITGYMNQQFLEQISMKTRRGQIAAVEDGRSGGGRCYGYRQTSLIGQFEIDPTQAEVVRRIFTQYVAGASPRGIAEQLNADGERGPRGGTWTASAINGDRRTGDGILHQKLYIGVRVFNRRHYRKHPDTGKRSSVLRPQSEWIERPQPDLRIIDDPLWQAAQNRKLEMSAVPRHHTRRPKRLLSGLMRCSECSGSMTLQGDRYACSAHRERGTCQNSRTVNADKLEGRVLAGLRDHLLSPDAMAQAAQEMQAEQAARYRSRASTVGIAERRLAEVKRGIARIVQSVVDGTSSPSLINKLSELEAQETALIAEIASAHSTRPIYSIHPSAADGYRRLIENLLAHLNYPAATEARSALRRLIGEVTFIPLAERGQYDLQITGVTAELFARTGSQSRPKKTSQAETCEVMMGAGAGFEPATFRL